MGIPKYPEVPRLTQNQIEEITEIVFGTESGTNNSDLIFIFGSTHPANYQKAIEAYHKGWGKEIVVAGGSSGSKDKHKEWVYGDESEARVICEKLVENGVPRDKIFIEEKSTDSKENIVFAKEIYDFFKIKSLTFISKNYVAGRQYRTLRKYLPCDLIITPYSYNIYFDNGVTFDRYDWMNYDKSKSLVFGEYLRIIYYGRRGDIENVGGIIKGLEKHIEEVFLSQI
jgi:uncharacterized SAM-binding protein YcdF (DUF218 family)